MFDGCEKHNRHIKKNYDNQKTKFQILVVARRHAIIEVTSVIYFRCF